jgi:hypothetical protein
MESSFLNILIIFDYFGYSLKNFNHIATYSL